MLAALYDKPTTRARAMGTPAVVAEVAGSSPVLHLNSVSLLTQKQRE